MNPRIPPPPALPKVPADVPAPASRRVEIESHTLFKGSTEVLIRHGGREYRLRRTRFDKLILTA